MAKQDTSTGENEVQYYVYLGPSGSDLSDAEGAARLELKNGMIKASYYLDGDEWVWDGDVARDISGVGGTSHMQRVTEDELRALIEEKSPPEVDPDKILAGP